MRNFLFASLLVSSSLVGCSKSDSGDILVSGMYGSISAQAQGDGKTVVSTTLYLGSPLDLNFIELTDGDKIIVQNGDSTMQTVETDILNIVSYAATFQTEAEDETFEIKFLRTVDAGAPSTLVSLPSPFTLAPLPSSSSRAAALNLDWTPSGRPDPMHIVLEGSCIDSINVQVPSDSGSVAIAADEIKKKTPAQGEVVPDTCMATVHVDRSREGDLDPHFGKGGAASAVQTRVATFMTTP